MIKYLDNQNDFDNSINERCLVDFYADWCGPCKMLGPILEQIEGIDILKVNVDTFQEIANRYGVMSIPTLIYFKDGKEVSKLIGLQPKEKIESIIK